MIARTNQTISYLMWLKRVLDAHLMQNWDTPATSTEAAEDDELNDLWSDIEEPLKHRIWGLSADLNTLRDRETWVESDWAPLSEAELSQRQREAFERKDWDAFLESLRRPPRFLPQHQVDYLRGRAWMELGHPEVALLFFDNAARLKPRDATSKILALECLKSMGDWPNIFLRGETYRDDPASAPRLLFRAADALLYSGLQSGDDAFVELALECLDRGFQRSESAQTDEPVTSIVVNAYTTKALCLAHLGRHDKALAELDLAVARNPDNSMLRSVRGLLRQESGRTGALDDYRQAAQRGTTAAWPYIELARDAIERGDDESAVRICRLGLEHSHRGTLTATLYELLAIASLGAGHPPATARAAFEQAAELDPLNDTIRENRARFEERESQRAPGQARWEVPQLRRETMLGEFLATSRYAN